MEGLIYVRLRDSGQIFAYSAAGFIVKEGEYVRLNTDDFSYLERVTTKSMKTGAEVPPSGAEKTS